MMIFSQNKQGMSEVCVSWSVAMVTTMFDQNGTHGTTSTILKELILKLDLYDEYEIKICHLYNKHFLDKALPW